MEAMICELCGSNDIIKQDGLFVCQKCGTKYSLEEAKKLIGTVKNDKSADAQNLLTLARRARDENNEQNAAKYYDMVLREDPTNWEASFYQVYYQAMGCTVAQISNAAYSIANNLDGTFGLIHDHVDPEKQEDAVAEVIARCTIIARMFASAALKNCNGQIEGSYEKYKERVKSAGIIYDRLEKAMVKWFGDMPVILANLRKKYVEWLASWKIIYDNSYRLPLVNRLTEDIRKTDSSYTPPADAVTPQKGGCYVATCVYGSYDCPEVWTLRRYRDNSMAATWYGRCFIKLYYAFSPRIVRAFGQKESFRRFWKQRLDRIVSRLQNEGFSDQPYEDRNW